MNKKAFLLGNKTIEIIVAVMVIALLIYLGTSLYAIFGARNNLERAESHMNQIKSLIDSIQENQEREYLLNSPEDWTLFYFTDKTTFENYENLYVKRTLNLNPECIENCICFCPQTTKSQTSTSLDGPITGETNYEITLNCDKGTCFNYNNEVSGDILTGISPITPIKITQKNNIIEISRK